MKFKVQEIREEEGGKIIAVVEGEGMKPKHKQVFIDFFNTLTRALKDQKIKPAEIFMLITVIQEFFEE